MTAVGGGRHLSDLPGRGRVFGRAPASIDPEILRIAAAGGLGLIQIASDFVWREVTLDKLVSVLDDWRPPALEARLILPPGHHRPRKPRAFETFLVETGQRFRTRWNIRDPA
jgi:DNA-binding transcriptional LysR family regulator